MTNNQRKFADEYIKDCNGTRAYKMAYKHIKSDEVARANGSRLLANANVREYIDEKLEEISSTKIADTVEVMEYLTAVLRGETKSEVIAVTDILEKAPDEKEKLKAAELLGKRYGIFTDKIKHENAVPVTIIGDECLEE